ncbi:MAG: hypothetical protein IJ886_08870 [Prevotella sp.]|nr:hypothetical protein [Prevotella sp.]MBR2230361.1 hypothetical protein [Prevotella sp.]
MADTIVLYLVNTDSGFGFTTSKSYTFGSKSYDVTLSKLNYNKKVYQPGEIYATIEISADTDSTLPSYMDVKGALFKKKAMLKINGYEVATNYYVHKVKPHQKHASEKTSMEVELSIFSKDKLMTLDKHSKAYTAKRLRKDIFLTEYSNYKLDGVAVEIEKDKTETVKDKRKSVEKKGEDVVLTTSNLQILSYKTAQKIYDEDKNVENELRQPYLVQYNESFYDFLKRTANRCGEFLYHEDGTLHLGLNIRRLDTGTSAVDYSTKASEYYYENVLQEGIEVEDYGYSYLKNENRNSPHHAPAADNATKFYYSDPLTTDEYLGDIGKDYTTYGAQWAQWEKLVLSELCSVLQGTSLSAIISGMLVRNAYKAGFVYPVAVKNLNYASKKVNIYPWQKPDPDEGKDSNGMPKAYLDEPRTDVADQWDNDTLRQFGTAIDPTTNLGKEQNIRESFYSLIRKAEKEVSGEAVWLVFDGSYEHLRIGDVIKVENTSYLVIQVKGCAAYDSGEGKETVSEKVVAIPLYNNSLPIPPALPKITVRESQPQLAFITSTGFLDPKKIGRVRVRFAWQEAKGDGSPWIRVMMPFATNGGGVKFNPQPDDEVMVSFEEGNVERPYVSGYLLSPRSNESWKALPDRTITSKNGHSITFNDNKDGGSFFYNLYPGLAMMRSFFPMALWPNVLTDKDECLALSGGMTISDRYGLYKICASSDSRSIMIQSAMGNVTLNAFTGINITAPNGNINISGKNVNIKASNKVNITSGTDIANRFFSAGGPEDSAYGFSASEAGRRAMRTLIDTGVGILEGFSRQFLDKLLDLSFFRTIIEIVIRPIDGTTKIKSMTFVEIEAGRGSVEFPADQIVKSHTKEGIFPKWKHSVDAICAMLNKVIKRHEEAYYRLRFYIKYYKRIIGDNGLNKNELGIKFDDICSQAWKKDRSDKMTLKIDFESLQIQDLPDFDRDAAIKEATKDIELKAAPNPDDYENRLEYLADKREWDNIIGSIEEQEDDHQIERNSRAVKRKLLQDTADGLYESLANFYDTTLIYKCEIGGDLPPYSLSSLYKDEIFDSLSQVHLKDYDEVFDGQPKLDTFPMDIKKQKWEEAKTFLKRKAVDLFTRSVSKDLGDLSAVVTLKITGGPDDNNYKDDSWDDYVDKLVGDGDPAKPAKGFGGKYVGQKLVKTFKTNWWDMNYADPWRDTTVNRHRWRTGVQGKILMSDSPATTISFDRKGGTVNEMNVIASNTKTEMIEVLKGVK